ncbi:MAG: DegT/DnrJ/EryC1/StrS family aminotransferase [Planctomycetota bacterium]|nr:DegT/DnrJ/EryC1/StrS family aminotransferase [Planctomycetota bacterium]
MKAGEPENLIPIVRPTLPDMNSVVAALRRTWESGIVTCGPEAAELERMAAEKAGTGHAVAFSSCTSALILSLQAMRLSGEVILPGFTFAATALAVVRNGLTPVFVDCEPDTFTISPEAVRKAITKKTCAIMPVYVFGLPPDWDALKEVARKAGVPIISDSAQGFGAAYRGKPAGGFGRVECFSLSPTKVVTAVEGGLATTDDAELAAVLRRLRDYGKAADGEDMEYIGLSARPSEMHAAVGRLSMARMEELVARRRELMAEYRERLSGVRGISFQSMPPGRETSGNYFVILVDPSKASRDRDSLYKELKARGIQTKRYFYPPVHLQTAYRGAGRVAGKLEVTETVSARSLALPLYTHMSVELLAKIADAVRSLLS